jgi:hypothetical protein
VQQAALDNKEKCDAVGEKLYEQDVKQYNTPERPISVFTPKYAYNSILNTCLYEGGYRDGGNYIDPFTGKVLDSGIPPYVIWWVKDSLTNKELGRIQVGLDEIMCSQQTCTKNSEAEVNEFFKQADELMGVAPSAPSNRNPLGIIPATPITPTN